MTTGCFWFLWNYWQDLGKLWMTACFSSLLVRLPLDLLLVFFCPPPSSSSPPPHPTRFSLFRWDQFLSAWLRSTGRSHYLWPQWAWSFDYTPYLYGTRVVTVVVFFGRPLALFGGGVEHGDDREHGRVVAEDWGVRAFCSHSLVSLSLRRKEAFV